MASVATMILQESLGSLNRCAWSNFVPEKTDVVFRMEHEKEGNEPGGSDP